MSGRNLTIAAAMAAGLTTIAHTQITGPHRHRLRGHSLLTGARRLGRRLTGDAQGLGPVAKRGEGHFTWVSADGCGPSIGDYPANMLRIEPVDGSHTGLCIAMMRDHYGDSGDSALDIAREVDYIDVYASCVEVVIGLGIVLAEDDMLMGSCACGECDLTDAEDSLGPDDVAINAGRILSVFAQKHERLARHHQRSCWDCTEAGERSPLALAGIFFRDIADDMLSNSHSPEIEMRAVPLVTAFAAVCTLVDTITEHLGVEPHEQIDALTTALAECVASRYLATAADTAADGSGELD